MTIEERLRIISQILQEIRDVRQQAHDTEGQIGMAASSQEAHKLAQDATDLHAKAEGLAQEVVAQVEAQVEAVLIQLGDAAHAPFNVAVVQIRLMCTDLLQQVRRDLVRLTSIIAKKR